MFSRIQILRLVDVRNADVLRNGATSGDFPFLFCIFDDIIQLPSTGRATSQSIPSTTHISATDGLWCGHTHAWIGHQKQQRCTVTSDVKYEVQTIVYRGDQIIQADRREVCIYDTADSKPPPIHISDFADEFTISQEKGLRKVISPRPRLLTVSTSETAPLEITSDGKIHMVTLPLHFDLQQDPKDSGSIPGPLSISLNSVLESHTFISTTEMRTQPAQSHVKAARSQVVINAPGAKQTRKLQIADWQPSLYSNSDAWVCDTSVLLPVCADDFPAPSFFMSYLSRRYALALSIDADSASGKASFELNVPLQIVYPTDGAAAAPAYQLADSAPGSLRGSLSTGDEQLKEVDGLPEYVR